MTVRFKGTELRPVLTEAVTNQCRVLLVKDQGVYFLAELDNGICIYQSKDGTRLHSWSTDWSVNWLSRLCNGTAAWVAAEGPGFPWRSLRCVQRP